MYVAKLFIKDRYNLDILSNLAVDNTYTLEKSEGLIWNGQFRDTGRGQQNENKQTENKKVSNTYTTKMKPGVNLGSGVG